VWDLENEGIRESCEGYIVRIRHSNLVKVRGFCWRQDEKLLIFDFIYNGWSIFESDGGEEREREENQHSSFHCTLSGNPINFSGPRYVPPFSLIFCETVDQFLRWSTKCRAMIVHFTHFGPPLHRKKLIRQTKQNNHPRVAHDYNHIFTLFKANSNII